jgi:hypothetical protein
MSPLFRPAPTRVRGGSLLVAIVAQSSDGCAP